MAAIKAKKEAKGERVTESFKAHKPTVADDKDLPRESAKFEKILKSDLKVDQDELERRLAEFRAKKDIYAIKC